MTLLVLMTCMQSDPAGQQPLAIWPDNISKYVHQNVGLANRPLGYSRQEMSSFPGSTYRLGYVSQLFSDAETIPQQTNELALQWLTGSYEKSTAAAMRLLGSKIEPVTPDVESAVTIEPADASSKKTWEALPQEIRRAVEQLVRGITAARPQLDKAFNWTELGRQTGDAAVRNLGTRQVYNYAAAPWLGGWGGASFAALNSFQATPLGNGGAIVLASVRLAINDLLVANQQQEIVAFDACRLKTSVGTVQILGRGNNVYQGTDAIVIDLGGDDRYSGRLAVPVSKNAPVGLLIDLGGNDTYDGRQSPASIACGLFGIGALFDLGGHDKYYCGDSGLGCGWHGIGLLVDTVGNDVYSGHQWCQGAAHAGVGMLIDDAGNDQYLCQVESQGLGATLGIGVLIDRAGNDRYHAYDNENGRRITFPSSQSKSHEASLVQGCGYGRRADGSDGRSMAGGVGALIDGAGDDTYYGGVFSQATGFWWSLGMLVDFGGNDKYRGVYYAQGAAAHFAIGAQIDHAGNDQYNDRGVLGQVLGAGRDGSVGLLLDREGDDTYYIPKKSAGGGDMNALGVFCDAQGDDKYFATGSSYLGTASFSNPRGEYFRRTMPTIGVFVDLAGSDTYPSNGPEKNNSRWHHQSGSPTWGFGVDTAPKNADKPLAAKPSESTAK